jgi:ABC-type multidrug transport system ATPase subunit
LIKNSPIICLDEPTAALDAKSENYIRDSLMEMIQGKTVLMVTHRKALLALMDTVYVLENGTLKNVNELGGLDHYLSLLEGIDQKQVEDEIAEDKQFITQEMIEAYLASKIPKIEETAAESFVPSPSTPPVNQSINENNEVEIKLR